LVRSIVYNSLLVLPLCTVLTDGRHMVNLSLLTFYMLMNLQDISR